MEDFTGRHVQVLDDTGAVAASFNGGMGTGAAADDAAAKVRKSLVDQRMVMVDAGTGGVGVA